MHCNVYNKYRKYIKKIKNRFKKKAFFLLTVSVFMNIKRYLKKNNPLKY